MLLQNRFILTLDLPSDSLVTGSLSSSLQHHNLVFQFVVLKCQHFLGLPQLMHFFTVLIGRLFKQRYFSWKLPLPCHALSDLFLHLPYFSLQVSLISLRLSKHSCVFLMLFFDLFEMDHQNRILPHQKTVLLFELTHFLSLIPCNSFDDLVNILVFMSDYKFEFVIFCQDLLANTYSVRKLPLQHPKFLPEQ